MSYEGEDFFIKTVAIPIWALNYYLLSNKWEEKMNVTSPGSPWVKGLGNEFPVSTSHMLVLLHDAF